MEEGLLERPQKSLLQKKAAEPEPVKNPVIKLKREPHQLYEGRPCTNKKCDFDISTYVRERGLKEEEIAYCPQCGKKNSTMVWKLRGKETTKLLTTFYRETQKELEGLALNNIQIQKGAIEFDVETKERNYKLFLTSKDIRIRNNPSLSDDTSAILAGYTILSSPVAVGVSAFVGSKYGFLYGAGLFGLLMSPAPLVNLCSRIISSRTERDLASYYECIASRGSEDCKRLECLDKEIRALPDKITEKLK